MRSLKVNLILWLSIALTFETDAQLYKLLLRGQASPYDSGVVIEIRQYRRESAKLDLADQLVDSLASEIRSRARERVLSDSIVSDQARAIATQAQAIERKDTTIAALNKNYMRLRDEAIDINKKKWFERPEIVGPGAALVGMILQAILSR